MLIIAFGHKAHHGKDSAAAHLFQRFGAKIDIQRFGFGDEVKRELNQAFADSVLLSAESFAALKSYQQQAVIETFCIMKGVAYDRHPDMSDPRCPYGKQRALLQWWGTEYRRKQVPDYWVVSLFATLHACEPGIALITDLRYPNEFDAVKANGGVTVRLDRPGYEIAPELAAHSSETALDTALYDHVLEATSLEELQKKVENLFLDICKNHPWGQRQ